MDDVVELLERAATHGFERGAPAVWSAVVAEAAEPSAEDPSPSALEFDLDTRPVEVRRAPWPRFAIAAVIVAAVAVAAGGVLGRARRDDRSLPATFPTDLATIPHWRVSPDHVPTPDSRTIDIEVEETACASGQPATGHIKTAITYGADQVAIAVTMTPVQGVGLPTCPSNPVTPFTVALTEALGTRRIVGENWPQPTGTSPPPPPTSQSAPTATSPAPVTYDIGVGSAATEVPSRTVRFGWGSGEQQLGIVRSAGQGTDAGPTGLSVGPDGTTYLFDGLNGRIVMVGADSTVQEVSLNLADSDKFAGGTTFVDPARRRLLLFTARALWVIDTDAGKVTASHPTADLYGTSYPTRMEARGDILYRSDSVWRPFLRLSDLAPVTVDPSADPPPPTPYESAPGGGLTFATRSGTVELTTPPGFISVAASEVDPSSGNLTLAVQPATTTEGEAEPIALLRFDGATLVRRQDLAGDAFDLESGPLAEIRNGTLYVLTGEPGGATLSVYPSLGLAGTSATRLTWIRVTQPYVARPDMDQTTPCACNWRIEPISPDEIPAAPPAATVGVDGVIAVKFGRFTGFDSTNQPMATRAWVVVRRETFAPSCPPPPLGATTTAPSCGPTDGWGMTVLADDNQHTVLADVANGGEVPPALT